MPKKTAKANVLAPQSEMFLPTFISTAARTRRGTNSEQLTYSDLSGELENVGRGVSPFGRDSSGSIGGPESVFLCQKAYWNIPIFRNTIDIQTEFTNSRLRFKGKNKRAVTFFERWWEKIDGWNLSEKWFREWFRSGNVFAYKFLYEIPYSELNKLARAAVQKIIPLRYTILNPADMRCDGGASFIDAEYSKMLNQYELARLKNPRTDDEKRFLESLDPKVREQIKKGEVPLIKIKPEYLNATFCGKQDYEALAIPMYYPVLFDIDLKLEFKKMEKVVARTADFMILLVTAGDPDRDASQNAMTLGVLQELFESESVGRVLLSDYSTKAEFVLPDLNKILGPDKYKVVNEDIANGLMNIFWGEEKFANSMVKIKVFLERLQSARDAFINGFLRKEMKLIADEMNFVEVPEPVFDEVDLKDEVEHMKIYSHLAEIGILTPAELFEAMQTHSLPLVENSLLSQQEFRKQRDKGYYEPIVGGPKKEEGRPTGSKAPKAKKKVGPIGASKYSLQKITDRIRQTNDLLDQVEVKYREKNQIKRLDSKEKQICWAITESIVSSASAEDWEKSIDSFLENPMQTPSEETLEIAAEHNLSLFLAGILKDSEI